MGECVRRDERLPVDEPLPLFIHLESLRLPLMITLRASFFHLRTLASEHLPHKVGLNYNTLKKGQSPKGTYEEDLEAFLNTLSHPHRSKTLVVPLE